MTEEQIQEIELRFKQYADKYLNQYSIITSDNWSLIHEIRILQQQQKQLIEELQWIKLHSNERHIVQRAVAALQQIQGKET